MVKPATADAFVNFKTNTAGVKGKINVLGLLDGEGFFRGSFSPNSASKAQISVGVRGQAGSLLKLAVGDISTTSLLEYSADNNNSNDSFAIWGQRKLPSAVKAVANVGRRFVNWVARKEIIKELPTFVTQGFQVKFDGTYQSLNSSGDVKPERVKTLDNSFNSVSNSITNEVTRQLSSVGEQRKVPTPVSKLPRELDSLQNNGSISNQLDQQLNFVAHSEKR